MVSNYKDFILEGKIVDLLLESDLQASSNFLDKIKSISKKNKIAQIIFGLFNDEVYISSKLSQNYIDIATEDTVSFLSDDRAEKINTNDDSFFLAKGRSSIKIGRFVKALLTNKHILSEIDDYVKDADDFKLSEKDIEEFVNLYKSTNINKSKAFKLVKGSDIPKWYSEDKYGSERGTLGGSCMKDVDKDYFEIYEENEKVCKLLIYTDSDKKLIGRALVWKLHKSPCKAEYFMDRVYCSSDSDVLKFINYAEQEGWLYKYRMNSYTEESLLFYYKGNPVMGKISVKLEKHNFSSYPFLDTLTFYNDDNGTLSNIGFKNGIMLDSTDGTSSRCSNCDGDGTDGDGNDCDDCTGLIDSVVTKIKKYSFANEFRSIV